MWYALKTYSTGYVIFRNESNHAWFCLSMYLQTLEKLLHDDMQYKKILVWIQWPFQDRQQISPLGFNTQPSTN